MQVYIDLNGELRPQPFCIAAPEKNTRRIIISELSTTDEAMNMEQMEKGNSTWCSSYISCVSPNLPHQSPACHRASATRKSHRCTINTPHKKTLRPIHKIQ